MYGWQGYKRDLYFISHLLLLLEETVLPIRQFPIERRTLCVCLLLLALFTFVFSGGEEKIVLYDIRVIISVCSPIVLCQAVSPHAGFRVNSHAIFVCSRRFFSFGFRFVEISAN
jgi:hypothetical protein